MKRINRTYRHLLAAVLLLLPLLVQSQIKQYIPLVREMNFPLQTELDTLGSTFHPAIRPYQVQDIDSVPWFRETFLEDYLADKYLLSLTINKKSESSPIKFVLLPIGQLYGGFQSGNIDKEWLLTSIGFNFSAMVGNKLEVNVNFLSSNSSFPSFIETFIFNKKVVPGQGWGSETRLGYYYRNSTWHVSYSPARWFNFTIGRGKNFLGEGYRSLLLSDGAYNYNYGRLTFNLGKFKYMMLYTGMKDIYNVSGAPDVFNRKYGAFHYLSINIGRRWNVGLFEGIVWQGNDSTFNRGYDVNYMNPLIFLRPVEYSLGSSDNALVGLNASVKIVNPVKIYGQFLLDEFKLSEIKNNTGWWANKFGTQIGIKYYNAFTLKRLTVQAEWNMVRPFTYSHDNAVQAYGHWNEPLAHPSGANFNEYVFIANYYIKRFAFEIKQTILHQGVDSDTLNYGYDIFKSNSTRYQDYDNRVGQGISRKLYTTRLHASWLVSTRANIRIEADISYYYQDIAGTRTDLFWAMLGIRTALYNRYWDF